MLNFFKFLMSKLNKNLNLRYKNAVIFTSFLFLIFFLYKVVVHLDFLIDERVDFLRNEAINNLNNSIKNRELKAKKACLEHLEKKTAFIENSSIILEQNTLLFNRELMRFINNSCYFTHESFHFRAGFNNSKTYILAYLSIWQYWWWFWFIALIIFYYILVFKQLIFRQKKFYPKINTSLKSHGRWGDFLIAIIPVFWCTNILINSNALLKIFEWQYESNFLNVRIRGKQWYWVYKVDFANLKSIGGLNKKVGNNFTLDNSSAPNLNLEMSRYLENLWQYRFYKKYNSNIVSSNKYKIAGNWYSSKKFIKVGSLSKHSTYLNNGNVFYNKKTSYINSYFIVNFKNLTKNAYTLYSFSSFLDNYNYKNFFNKYDFNYFNRAAISKNYFFLNYNLSGDFFINWNNGLAKNSNPSFSISLKQKRIEFNAKNKFYFYNTFSKQKNLFVPFLKYNNLNNSLIANRLLSTNFTLVLPANVTISIITNSFDVIHSWFVPGLGIKMDCVPGKSTHHSFFLTLLVFSMVNVPRFVEDFTTICL